MQPLLSVVESVQKQRSPITPLIQPSWWVEINTLVPLCTYYFGPFDSQEEAKDSRSGYVDDLYQEGARNIVALIKQCDPENLTIDQGYFFTQA